MEYIENLDMDPVVVIGLIIIAVILGYLVYNNKHVDILKSLQTQALGSIESISSNIKESVGKWILFFNTKGNAVVFNYPLEKGFLSRLFEKIEMPQI